MLALIGSSSSDLTAFVWSSLLPSRLRNLPWQADCTTSASLRLTVAVGGQAPSWFRQILNPGIAQAFRDTQANLPNDPIQPAFNLDMCMQLADDLRGLLALGGVANDAAMQTASNWILRMQHCADVCVHVRVKGDLASFAQIIELVLMADKLRDSGDLRLMLEKSLEIVLPPELLAIARQQLSCVKHLDKSQVSR